MFNLPDFDLTRFDVRNIDLPKVDMPKFELPKFELPFDVSKLDLPTFDLPKIDVNGDRIVGLARDAAYVGIGAAVMTAQLADERRRQLTDQVTAGVRKLVDSVA